VLNYVGLGEARYRPVESYSTGMKQRLKLASAIVHDPQMLILDEPTNGMDPAGREEVLELARDLAHNKGMSLLFSSHLLPDVEAVCDHVLVLAQGRLLAQGKIQDLKQAHDRMVEVRVKADQDRFARQLTQEGCAVEPYDDLLRVRLPVGGSRDLLWRLAAASGEQIRYLRPQRSTLEEVFLQAVEGRTL
jgi:ABC-2 type transport system ATP-binding protein